MLNYFPILFIEANGGKLKAGLMTISSEKNLKKWFFQFL